MVQMYLISACGLQRHAPRGTDMADHTSHKHNQTDAATGISNRETPQEEAQEREAYPPLDPSSPPPEDAAGRVGEQPLEDLRDRHTSHKAGSRSIAQKEAETRYPDR